MQSLRARLSAKSAKEAKSAKKKNKKGILLAFLAPWRTWRKNAVFFASESSLQQNYVSGCYDRPMEHLEGKQSIIAALQARQRRFQVILVSQSAHEEKVREVIELAGQFNVPVRRAESRELDAMAHGATHGGVLAVVSAKPRLGADELIELVDSLTEPALFLLIEGIEDARNLGFVLRTAEAVGAHAVLIKKHLWDFDSVEIARPASGAYERLPLVQLEDVEPLRQLKVRGLQLIGCLAGVKRTLYEANLTVPCILAIGGEKRGLSGAVRSECDGFLTIPSKGGASSLSLSHSSAIILAEAMRQRLTQPSQS